VELDLFFIGAGVLQLLTGGEPFAAGLPATLRGWRALAELTRLQAWAESGLLDDEIQRAAVLLDSLAFVQARQMPALQARCDRVLVL
jgi:hypothetical protein